MPSLALIRRDDAAGRRLCRRAGRADLAARRCRTLRRRSQGRRRFRRQRRISNRARPLRSPSPAEALRGAKGPRIGALGRHPRSHRPRQARVPDRPRLLAPSTCRRSRPRASPSPNRCWSASSRSARTAAARARQSAREAIAAILGEELGSLKPGSPAAMRLKEALVAAGGWSQYLEVGIGPDAEVFTKSQPMSAVGCGDDAGFHSASQWNNPEPEVALVVASSGRIVGATLANDVNLRDFEGRSRAAPGQGEGPKRELRARALPAPLRFDLLASTMCARRRLR